MLTPRDPAPTCGPLSARVASPGLLNCLHLPLLTPEFQRRLGAHLGLSVIKYAYFLKPKVFSRNVISGKLFYRKWKSKINTLRCHPVPPGQLFTALEQNKLAKCGTWFPCGVSRITWTPVTTPDALLVAASTPLTSLKRHQVFRNTRPERNLWSFARSRAKV